MHVRTCSLVRHLCREIKSKIELKHFYIYDFDPKAVQSSSAASRDRYLRYYSLNRQMILKMKSLKHTTCNLD